MPLPQAPAYLQPSTRPALNEAARDGIGGGLPPHISIKGNTFTAVDAAGNQYNIGPVMQAAVIDVSNVICKMYFGTEYKPGDDQPPKCFSTNGIGPSIEASEPQARTCAECPMNVRGSAVSKISGAATKACRDEKHIALMFPGSPQMLLRLVVTPGSFKNWSAYIESIKGVALQDLVTQFDFVPQENGMLQFSATAYIPQELIPWREQAYAEAKTDAIVGRLDKPRVPALAAPAAQPQIAAQPEQVQQPAPFAATAAVAPSAPLIQAAAAPAATVSAAVPSSEPTRRRRRAAESAAPAAAPAAVTAAHGSSFAPAAAPVAPFRAAATASATAPANGLQNPAFGIGQGTPPNAELVGMLNQIFPQALAR